MIMMQITTKIQTELPLKIKSKLMDEHTGISFNCYFNFFTYGFVVRITIVFINCSIFAFFS